MLALVALALASVLASSAVALSDVAAGGVAVAGTVGVVLLAWALIRGLRSPVAVAVGLLALATTGANRTSFALVPVESVLLVAVALLTWWSIDERPAMDAVPGVDNGRFLSSAALAIAAGGLAILVVAMASVASPGLVGPVVGAVGMASIAAVLWSATRLARYEAERRT